MNEAAGVRLMRDIAVLVDLFKAGDWAEVRLESEGLSLLLSNDRSASLGSAATATNLTTPAARPLAIAAAGVSTPAELAAPLPDRRIDADWEAVKAPNLGTFYRSPKPGAPAFVEVGQRVEPDTEVCLIEVMKLFTSVQAGVAGIVRHIAVADAELVEGGQALMFIERN